MKAKNPCEATEPHATLSYITWKCTKSADHILKAGKFARQHVDTKNYPSYYWNPTDEEIANYKARITNAKNGTIQDSDAPANASTY